MGEVGADSNTFKHFLMLFNEDCHLTLSGKEFHSFNCPGKGETRIIVFCSIFWEFQI